MPSILGSLLKGKTIAQKREELMQEEPWGITIKPIGVPSTSDYARELQRLIDANVGLNQHHMDAALYGMRAMTPPIRNKNLTRNFGTKTMAIVQENEAYNLLAMRLRLKSGEMFPMEHLSLHVTDTCAYLFLVNKGEPIIIHDDPALFPSDQLITKLRLMIG